MGGSKSSIQGVAEAVVELLRSVGWFGIALALALILVLRVALPRSERRRLRAPALLLTAHVALRLLLMGIGDESLGREPLYFLELLTLLLSIGRSCFILAFDVVLGRRLHQPLPAIIRDILQGVVYAGVTVVTLRAVGVDTGSLLTTSALLTAVVGLSLQDTLGNVFAGLAIQAQRPFDIGDWIQLNDGGPIVGRVVEINWRATRVITRDDVELIVPNASLAKAPIANYSKPTSLVRRNLYFQGPYGVPPGQVMAAIAEGLHDLPHVEADPAPNALVASFDDSGIRYWVRYYTRDFQRCEVTDAEVRARIWYALDRHGISIPFPIRTVRMDMVDPAQERARGYETRSAALAAVDLFKALPEAALTQLASASEIRRFTAGELILRQGERGDELFVIERGDVSILYTAPREARPTVLAELTRGDFFGEMGLMTGEERTASVRADTECELVVVNKDAFAPVLDHHPELAEQISRLLVARQDKLADHLESLPPSRRAEAEDRSSQLLGKIRDFFSL